MTRFIDDVNARLRILVTAWGNGLANESTVCKGLRRLTLDVEEHYGDQGTADRPPAGMIQPLLALVRLQECISEKDYEALAATVRVAETAIRRLERWEESPIFFRARPTQPIPRARATRPMPVPHAA